MTSTITFTGNYGSFEVDAATGDVVRHWPDHEEVNATDGIGYTDIVRVNLAERRDWYASRGIVLSDPQPDGDVLDVGAWCANGEYVEPIEDWREEVILCHYPDAVATVKREG